MPSPRNERAAAFAVTPTAPGHARRSGSLLRTLRIAGLAYVLAMVALTAWLTKARSTDWNGTLYMAIYPVNGDGSEQSQRYLSELNAAAFEPVAEFFAREGAHHGVDLEAPIAIELGTQLAQAPPAPPAGGNPLAIVWWSLRLRYFAWRTQHAQALPAPDIRMFVVYYDPQTHARLAHSLGLEKGLIGVVNAYADREFTGSNDVVIAHETLHTLGATDKYDPATSLPRFPDGYAEPERQPLYPQSRAEIMGGRIALSPTEAEMPARLALCVVGAQTATEIRWQR
jgi:hypothetical protein